MNAQLLEIRVSNVIGAPVRHRIKLDAVRELHASLGGVEPANELFVAAVPVALLPPLPLCFCAVVVTCGKSL